MAKEVLMGKLGLEFWKIYESKLVERKRVFQEWKAI